MGIHQPKCTHLISAILQVTLLAKGCAYVLALHDWTHKHFQAVFLATAKPLNKTILKNQKNQNLNSSSVIATRNNGQGYFLGFFAG